MPTMPNGSTNIDEDFVRSAVEKANANALRLALYQITGDPDLAAMKAAKGNVGGREFMDFRLTEGDAAIVKQKAFEFLRARQPDTPVPPPPSKADTRALIDMFAAKTDENEFEFGYEELAFEEFPRDVRWNRRPSAKTLANYNVLVIGAGISGIAIAIYLKRLGIPFTIIERQAELGGTWHLNRYPEVRVDTSSYLYQFKFEKKYPWSEYYATGEDTWKYLLHVAQKHQVVEYIQFNREVTDAVWDENRGRWTVSVSGADGSKETYDAKVVVSASGLFSTPKLPQIDGIEDFEGAMFHTANWDQSYDFRGKRVALVGTGSTGTQMVPRLAEDAKHLTIFQRTANWIMEQPNYRDAVSQEQHWLFDTMPYYWNWYCYASYFTGQQMQHLQNVDREWQAKGGKISEYNDKLNTVLKNTLIERFSDRPDLLKKVMPNHIAFTRRMIVTNGFYDALKREDVDLITDRIEKIGPAGIRTVDGKEREFDLIILGSGFSVQKYFFPTKYVGRNGITLEESWAKDGPRSYLGMALPGYPNLFIFYGPNGQPRSGGFYSWAEVWSRYICTILINMIENEIDAVEVTQEAFDAYNTELDSLMKDFLWTYEGHSYYVNEFGRVTVNVPWTTEEYHGMVRTPNMKDYSVSKREGGDTGKVEASDRSSHVDA